LGSKGEREIDINVEIARKNNKEQKTKMRSQEDMKKRER
jgi:hypothetical protein